MAAATTQPPALEVRAAATAFAGHLGCQPARCPQAYLPPFKQSHTHYDFTQPDCTPPPRAPTAAAPGPSSSCSDSQPGSTRPSPTAAAAASVAAAGPECFFLECQRELLQQEQPETNMPLAPAGDSSSAGSSLARWQAGGDALAAPRSPHRQLQQQLAQQPQRMQTDDAPLPHAQHQPPAQLATRATLQGSCSWLVTTGLGSGGASVLQAASAPASPGMSQKSCGNLRPCKARG